MRSTRKSKKNQTGEGFLNTAINSLPFKAHIPGYQFCRPGTKLEKRLARGDRGINQLDVACRDHDIAYSNSNNLNDRHRADKLLENRAWSRIKAKDSSLKEKAVAYAVVNSMKLKRKIGMGCNPKYKCRRIELSPKNKKRVQKKSRKNMNRSIATPRQIGGVLPLIPIFAGLSALGSIASGASSIYSTIKNSKKSGNGLYLNPHNGKGLYLNSKGSGVTKKKN